MLCFVTFRIRTISCCVLLRDVLRNMVFDTGCAHCCGVFRSMFRLLRHCSVACFRSVPCCSVCVTECWPQLLYPVPLHHRSATIVDLIIIIKLCRLGIIIIYVIYVIYVITLMTYKDCTSSPVLSLPWPLGSTNVASMSYL